MFESLLVCKYTIPEHLWVGNCKKNRCKKAICNGSVYVL